MPHRRLQPLQPLIQQTASVRLELIRPRALGTSPQVTILLLGKSGAGKSSTANSLLGERVAQVSVFQVQKTWHSPPLKPPLASLPALPLAIASKRWSCI